MKPYIYPSLMKKASYNTVSKAKRQYNIELLRIFSMFMIVLSHYVSYGIQPHEQYNKFHPEILSDLLNYLSLQLCSIFTRTGVNCFVLITGYFLIEKTQIRNSIIRLWFQVVFYALGMGLILFLLGQNDCFSITYVLKNLTPFPTDKYWFVSQYIGLVLLAPFLAQLTAHLNQKQMFFLLCLLLILFFRYPFGDKFTTGMSLSWFIYLFLVGGYIRKYGVPEWIQKHIVGLIWGCALSFLLLHTLTNTLRYFSSAAPFSIKLAAYNDLPFILSVLLFIYFSKKQWNGRLAQYVSRLAPYTFGIYLCHEDPIVRSFLWNKLIFIYNFSPYVAAGIIFSLIVFLCGAFIDCIREKIFKVCRINRLAQKLGSKIPQPFHTDHLFPKNKQI